MKQLNTYITEKLKIDKDSKVTMSGKNLKRFLDVKKFAKSLPYQYNNYIWVRSKYVNQSQILDGFYMTYKGNSVVDLFIMYQQGGIFTYAFVDSEHNNEVLYEEPFAEQIDKIDWENMLDPFKYIEYVRNIHPTSINRKHVHKLWMLADKLEELL